MKKKTAKRRLSVDDRFATFAHLLYKAIRESQIVLLPRFIIICALASELAADRLTEHLEGKKPLDRPRRRGVK